MRIQHNIMAMNAYRNYSNNTSALAKNLEKLSSGYKINRAGDDAAGLAISEKMRAQITGLKTAQKNAKDGISLIQTAEGALTEVHDMLNRALELADQSSNGTYDELDRAQMQKELDQLRSEINRIADSTNFNGIKLLDGSLDKKISDAMENIEGMVDNTDGMVINAPVNGAGQKETINIDLSADALFGKGDIFSFSFSKDDGNGNMVKETVDLSYDSTVAAGSETYTVNANANDTGAFGGATLKDQLESIAKVLNHGNSPLAAEYEASVKTDADGNAIGLSLTAKTEQVPTISIDETSFAVTDKQVTATKDITSSKTGSLGGWTVHKAENMGVNNLLNAKTGGNAPDLSTGDKVKFTFDMGDGTDRTVTLEAGKDFAIGDTVQDTTKALAEALQKANFDDDANTKLMDESQMKVGDHFTFTENKSNTGLASAGSIRVVAKTGTTAEIKSAGVYENDGTTLKGSAVSATVGQKAWTQKATATVSGNVSAGTLGSVVQLKNSSGSNSTLDLTATSSTVTSEEKFSLMNATHTSGKGAGVLEIESGVEIKFVDNSTAEGKVGEVNLDDVTDVASLLTAMSTAANNVSQAAHDAELAKDSSYAAAAPSVKTYTFSGTNSGALAAASVTSTQAYNQAALMTGTDAATKETVATDFTETFSAGNKVKVEGVLGDGRTFSIELEATNETTVGENQFKIGANTNASVDNIKAALANANNKVTITNADGTTTTVKANDIFDTDGAAAQIKVTSSSGKLTLESNTVGAAGKSDDGFSGAIAATSVTVDAGGPITIAASEKLAAKEPGKAQNMITFDPEKVEQGTTMEIDGKTYEFVTDANFVSKKGNIAVVVGNLGKRDTTGALANDAATGEDIANALKATLDAQDATQTDGLYVSAKGQNYSMTVDGNSLKIESVNEGTDAVALDVAAGTARRDAAIVKFATTEVGTKTNPKQELNVKVGDTVTINGKTYEFTDGEHRTKEEGNVAVSLKDVDTAQKAAHALADAVNAQDGGRVIASVNEKDGSVVLTSKFNPDADVEVKKEDPYAPPKVELPTDSNGLKLQIGDTAESFNQLTVSVQDMHAETLGIGELNIKDQDGAAAAVDALKKAINMVSDVRGTLGATQNRLDHTINNLSVMQENIQDAEASIRDVDVAQEMMEYTKNNILVQSAQAMLAQANQVPQGVLQLLQ